jgi:DNA ligase 1
MRNAELIICKQYPDVGGLVLEMLRRPPRVKPASFSKDPALSQPNETMLELLHTSKVTSFVMDAEIVAVDKDTGAYKTFQDLSNRAKKDVQVQDIKVIVGVFAFDLMLINDMVSCSPRAVNHCILTEEIVSSRC